MRETAVQAITKLRTLRPCACYLETPDYNSTAATVSSYLYRRGGERSKVAAQLLTLLLEGITAGDYLTWVRDSDPHALGRELHSLHVRADPLGDRIEVSLFWEGVPPDPRAAAATAGFELTPEVVELRATNQGRAFEPVGQLDRAAEDSMNTAIPSP